MNEHLWLRVEFLLIESFINFKSTKFQAICRKVNMMSMKPLLDAPKSRSGMIKILNQVTIYSISWNVNMGNKTTISKFFYFLNNLKYGCVTKLIINVINRSFNYFKYIPERNISKLLFGSFHRENLFWLSNISYILLFVPHGWQPCNYNHFVST